ncbi:hypothetical protein BOX15_Mlig020689g1 [Macrostomum lignano]|uniref:Uncharacterized protein n=1 Tax=Macrostomum lignano TaxID=282301 RepID=A0A267ET23_9PLAT|nr:hypothetical protein BOX15_Mlig020689g1 [Macrostomum lignano]
MSSTAGNPVIELNVGGVIFATTLETLRSESDSLLAEWFQQPERHLAKDSQGRFFIDRDGQAFGQLLNCLRDGGDAPVVVSSSSICSRLRLRTEATFYGLKGVLASLDRGCPQPGFDAAGPASACITVGYRGTFAFGRDGLADVKFRKLTRILVAGRISLCRQVFGDTLNESRDPDRGEDDRYTSRFFLKHNILEQAFEMLYDAGFSMVGSCGSGTNSSMTDVKPGQDNEETKWQHYNEFVFVRN